MTIRVMPDNILLKNYKYIRLIAVFELSQTIHTTYV